jgi:hypothetical protein
MCVFTYLCAQYNYLERGLCGSVRRGIAHSGKGSSLFYNVKDEVSLVVVGHTLQIQETYW